VKLAAPWLLSLWLFTAGAAADAPPAAVDPLARHPGAWSEPRVGECIGGDCSPLPREREPEERRRPPNRRARFAFTGAVLGTVTAGLALGGSIVIAAVDDLRSERVTRGLFFGAVTVVPPLVATAAFVARRGSPFQGYRGVRNLGWTAYGAAVVDGLILWYGAMRDVGTHPALTVAAGAISVFALLPHALDALVSSRHAVASRGLALTPRGIGYRF